MSVRLNRVLDSFDVPVFVREFRAQNGVIETFHDHLEIDGCFIGSAQTGRVLFSSRAPTLHTNILVLGSVSM